MYPFEERIGKDLCQNVHGVSFVRHTLLGSNIARRSFHRYCRPHIVRVKDAFRSDFVSSGVSDDANEGEID